MDLNQLQRKIRQEPDRKDLIKYYIHLAERNNIDLPMIFLNDIWYPVIDFEVITARKDASPQYIDLYEDLALITLVNGWQFYIYDGVINEPLMPEFFWETFIDEPPINEGSERVLSWKGSNEEEYYGLYFDYLGGMYGPYLTHFEAMEARKQALEERGKSRHIIRLRDSYSMCDIPLLVFYREEYNTAFMKLLENAFDSVDDETYEYQLIAAVPVVDKNKYKWAENL